MTGDAVGVVQETVDCVCDSTHTDRNGKSEDVDCDWTDQMILSEDEIISSIGDQVGLEPQTERNVQGNVSTCSQAEQLDEPDPFEYPGVLIQHFTLFEVKLSVGLGVGSMDKWLIEIGGMEDIIFEFEQPIDG